MAAARPGVPPTRRGHAAALQSTPGSGAGALRPCACAKPSSWAASVPSSSAPCGHRAGRVMGMLWAAGDVQGIRRAGGSPSAIRQALLLLLHIRDRAGAWGARARRHVAGQDRAYKRASSWAVPGPPAPYQLRLHPTPIPALHLPQARSHSHRCTVPAPGTSHGYGAAGSSGAGRIQPRSPCGGRSKRMWPSKCMAPWRWPSQSSHRLRGPLRFSCRHSAWWHTCGHTRQLGTGHPGPAGHGVPVGGMGSTASSGGPPFPSPAAAGRLLGGNVEAGAGAGKAA